MLDGRRVRRAATRIGGLTVGLVLALASASGAQVLPGLTTQVLPGLTTGFANDPVLTNPPLIGETLSTQNFWMQKAAGLGAGVIRVNVSWESVAPSEPPPGFVAINPASPGYDWTTIDEDGRSIEADGLQPMLMLSSAPRWAEGPSPPAGTDPGAGSQIRASSRSSRRPPRLATGQLPGSAEPRLEPPQGALLAGMERAEPGLLPVAAVDDHRAAQQSGALPRAAQRVLRSGQGGGPDELRAERGHVAIRRRPDRVLARRPANAAAGLLPLALLRHATAEGVELPRPGLPRRDRPPPVPDPAAPGQSLEGRQRRGAGHLEDHEVAQGGSGVGEHPPERAQAGSGSARSPGTPTRRASTGSRLRWPTKRATSSSRCTCSGSRG